MNKNVGIIGIGIMGTAMARNLCQAGFDVVGYDPVPEALARLKDFGGRALTSPRAVAEAAPENGRSAPACRPIARQTQNAADFHSRCERHAKCSRVGARAMNMFQA